MDIQWKSVFMLSLKDIALRRVGINVCSGPAILSLIEKFKTKQLISDFERKRLGRPDLEQSSHEVFQKKKIVYQFDCEWCRIVEGHIPDIMSELLAPVSIKKQIVPILKRIGLQMVHWKVFHEKYLDEEFGVPILSKMCWTFSGMVDYQKTALTILEGEMLNDDKLYKLACLYALVDYIPIFWEKLPTEMKKKYIRRECTSELEEPLSCHDGISVNENTTETSWHHFSGNPSNAFVYSACRGNKVATEYFFRKLPPEAVESSIQEFVLEISHKRYPKICQHPDEFPSEHFYEVFLYLISRVNEGMQRRMLRTHPSHLLFLLLDLPWQDLYLENAEIIWAHLSEDFYDNLLILLQYSTANSDTEFFLSTLLRKLCDYSPADFKKQFVKNSDLFFEYIPLLLECGDSKLIEVFLGEVDYAERFELLSSEEYLEQYCQCLRFDQMETVKACLENAMLSKEDLVKLFRNFVKFASKSKTFGSFSFTRKFILVLKEIFRSIGRKRSLEDEDQTEAVTPCTKHLLHIKTERFEMIVLFRY